MQQQSEQKKMYDECVIPREMSEQLMKEAKETLEKPEIKNDGCFTFDYFMKSQALVKKYWHMYAMPLIAKRTEARRALYCEEDFDTKVKTAIMQEQVWQENSQELINAQFYKHMGMSDSILSKSRQLYM